jgi:ribosomal 30S subunit maturation factor RimM
MRDQIIAIKKETLDLVNLMLNKNLYGYLTRAFNISDLDSYIDYSNKSTITGEMQNDSYFIKELLNMFVFARKHEKIGYFTQAQSKQIDTYLA